MRSCHLRTSTCGSSTASWGTARSHTPFVSSFRKGAFEESKGGGGTMLFQKSGVFADLWRIEVAFQASACANCFSQNIPHCRLMRREAQIKVHSPHARTKRPALLLFLLASDVDRAAASTSFVDFSRIYQSRMGFPVARFRPTQFTPQCTIARRPSLTKR